MTTDSHGTARQAQPRQSGEKSSPTGNRFSCQSVLPLVTSAMAMSSTSNAFKFLQAAENASHLTCQGSISMSMPGHGRAQPTFGVAASTPPASADHACSQTTGEDEESTVTQVCMCMRLSGTSMAIVWGHPPEKPEGCHAPAQAPAIGRVSKHAILTANIALTRHLQGPE